MRIKYIDKFDSFFFIGIGGVSMSGLAKYLISCNKKVGGSDICENEYTLELKRLGADISYENDTGNLADYDVIVYTDAVRESDARLQAALILGKEIISRGQFLYEVGRNFKKIIAVSGCHGKTTCTAMLAHVFSAAGKKFAAHIGGKDLTFSNFYYCGHDFFITEACEYKKNFLLLKPNISVVLNSDADHLECYDGEEDLKQSYICFAESADIAVTLYCDLPIEDSVSFGFDKTAEYYAKNIRSVAGKYSFTVFEREKELGTVNLNVYGKHNVLNALAACAAARKAGISFNFIKDGLSDFTGVKRRFESLGAVNGAECIADYAHHPIELRAVLRTAKKLTDGKMFVVFQPHTYSRTKNLFKQFVKVLAPINNLLIYKTFAAREYYDDSGSAYTLSQSLKKSRYGDCEADIKHFIAKAHKGDIILVLGAGDIYFTVKRIISARK